MRFGPADLRFVVDATVDSGFGHVARCLKLAELVKAEAPQQSIVFQGQFSEGARARVSIALGHDRVVGLDAEICAAVSVIDRMSDATDINAWDEALTQRIVASSRSTIAIFSGDRPPSLPATVICLGYQPLDTTAAPDGWLWSLDYAPVASDFLILPEGLQERPEPSRLLIAMGGSADAQGVMEAISAASKTDAVDRIDVLLSPLLVNVADIRSAFDLQRITWWSQVADIRPLILNAEVVMTSYGNLGFEALALGRSVCFFAQKPFQERMAQRMAVRAVAMNAGAVGETATGDVVSALSRAFKEAASLSRNARRLLDGKGMDRIRDIILKELCVA